MSIPNNVVFFCDDIREEKHDKSTYVGVLPNKLFVPVGSSELTIPKIIAAVFITWNKDTPPVGWSMIVDVPNATSVPFTLPPEGADDIPPDPVTNIVGIVVHAIFAPLVIRVGERVLVSLKNESLNVPIGALSVAQASG